MCRNDVIHAALLVAITPYEHRQQWPGVYPLPHWCSWAAGKSQIEASWRPKNDISPLSAHVHQRVPRLCPCTIIHIEIKYIQEGNVGEHVDCRPGYIAPVNGWCRLLCKVYTVRTSASFGGFLLIPTVYLLVGQRPLKVAIYQNR